MGGQCCVTPCPHLRLHQAQFLKTEFALRHNHCLIGCSARQGCDPSVCACPWISGKHFAATSVSPRSARVEPPGSAHPWHLDRPLTRQLVRPPGLAGHALLAEALCHSLASVTCLQIHSGARHSGSKAYQGSCLHLGWYLCKARIALAGIAS